MKKQTMGVNDIMNISKTQQGLQISGGGNFSCSLAFTLAEVLITLGIIGIVAALTIPNLIQNYQEKMFVNKLNQTYSQLLQAFRLMVDEYGTIDTWSKDTVERQTLLQERLPQFIKISPCDWQKCLGKTYSFHTDKTKKIGRFAWYNETYHMQNGAVLKLPQKGNGLNGECIQNMAMNQYGTNETGTRPIYYGTYLHGCGEFFVDLNGASGPNIPNIDTFSFKVVIDGIVPAGGPKEDVWLETFSSQCLDPSPTGYYLGRCAAWVIENKNMDYLHCNNLSWTGSRRCR